MKKLAFVLALLRAVPCFAQQGATASLTGWVNSGGQALPGVTVTLTSTALQGNRVALTAENGGYLFAFLPPGDYLLGCELEGFALVQERIRVPLAETTRVDVEMPASTLRETITVESDHVAADASIVRNLRVAELQRLPATRDIHAAVLLSSNATGSKLMIAGAPSWDSLFLVDGVVVNENLSGQPHNLFIEDAIEEIALLSGAISSEYGRFTGGVVSTLTKSGGNEFSGSLRDVLTNAAWTKRTPWSGNADSLNKINHAVETTLGGFLLRDRLWFFAAGRKAETTLGRFTAVTNIPYRAGSQEERWEGKLTSQIAASHSIIASYINTSLAETNVLDSRSSGRVLELASLIPRRWQPANLLALAYEGMLARNTFAEIHGSRKRYAFRGGGGRSSDRILGTLIVVRGLAANLNAPFGCGICGDDRRDNNAWTAKASHYSNTRWGNHTTVAGAEDFHEERGNHGTRSSSEFNIQIGSARILDGNAYPVFDPSANTLIDWTSPLGAGAARLRARSGYINDRWDATTRLSVNLGLRYDRNDVNDAIGRLISNDHAYSPRLSATFDLRNDGRHRLLATYGRYLAKIFEGGGAPQQVGVFRELGWRYRGPEINVGDPLLSASEALARLFAWFDSVGGLQNRQYLSFISDPRSSSQFHGSLKSPAVDERSVGYALQLKRAYFRVDYVSRDWRHFYAARVDTTTGQRADPSSGKNLDVAWIINDDSETVRTYRAIQLQGSWHYGSAMVGGGYTWSKLRGNDDEEEGTLSAPRNLPLKLYYPEFLGYPQRRPIGYLRQDQRHRARVWAGYEAALRRGSVSTFVVQWFDSGRAYSAAADIDPTEGYEGVPANPGYALNQVKTGPYYFSKRGAYRTDDLSSTDLALRYELPMRSLRIFIKADVLNLFNNAAVIAPDTQVLTRLRTGQVSGLRAFNPFTEIPVEGMHYRLSTTFGQATGPASYQTARTFQLSLGARF